MTIDLTLPEMKMLDLLLSLIEHSIATGEAEVRAGEANASEIRSSIAGKLWVAMCEADVERDGLSGVREFGNEEPRLVN